MTDGVKIRDVQSLEEMANLLIFTGESMATIEENVSNYINGVRDVLEKQLEFIGEKLHEAQERLNAAEESLSACESSQEYDEESQEYRPSCSCERSAVARAQKEVSEWKHKYAEGQRILYECKKEIEQYNYRGGMLTPPGGHGLIEYMVDTHTPISVKQLNAYIDHAYDVLQTDLGADEAEVQGVVNPHVKEDDLPMSENECVAKFKANLRDIKEEQVADANRWELKDANRAMRCPRCGRPLQLCVCKNLRVEAKIYQID